MKNLNENSDESLMIDFQNGSHEAFEVLYRRYKGMVYAYLKKRIRKNDDVDEVFQQVFLKLTASRLSYKSEFAFTQWLFAICKSILIDFYRKQSQSLSNSDADINSIEDESAPDLQLDKEFSLLSSELDEIQRKTVEFKVYDELTYEEIALRLNISQSNARQILSRSLRKLRLVLSTRGGGLE